MSSKVTRTHTCANKQSEPTFHDFCLLVWNGFKRLSKRYKADVVATLFLVTMSVGIGSFNLIDNLTRGEESQSTLARMLDILKNSKPVNLAVEVPTKTGVKRKVTNKAIAKKIKVSLEVATENYITRFSPTAIAEMKKYGIPASISLAQGLLESRAGTSTLAVKNNNHFGIKCFKGCRGKHNPHCSQHHDDIPTDRFLKYQSAWYSWRGHSKLLSSGSYKKLHKHGNDYKAWAYGLKKCGYATSRTYARDLIRIIDNHNLDRFDG